MSLKTSKASASARCAAHTALLNGGTLELRTGSPPSTPESTQTGTVLSTHTLPNPAFGTPVTTSGDAVATANAITSVSASATGTAGYFCAKDSSGNPVEIGTVTATGGGGDLTVDNTSIASGQSIAITTWTITDPT